MAEERDIAEVLSEDEEEDKVEEKGTRKHVTIEDEPEVFTIVPDSTQVAKQEKPKFIEILEIPAEELTPEKIEFLIHETEDIIRACEEKVLCQKLNNAKLGCLLARIGESIEEYESYMCRLVRFLVNGDDVTGKYFIDVCERLPCFGDYLASLSGDDDSELMIEEISGPVKRSELLKFVKEIVDNTYNGGKFLGSFRTMNKTIDKCMRVRTQVTEQFSRQIKTWLKLNSAESEHLDELRNRLSRLSAYLHIVRSGDARIKYANDTSGGGFESCVRTIFHSSMLGESTVTSGMSIFMNSLEDSRNQTFCRDPPVFVESSLSPESRCFLDCSDF